MERILQSDGLGVSLPQRAQQWDERLEVLLDAVPKRGMTWHQYRR
jgi:hypothetical protein